MSHSSSAVDHARVTVMTFTSPPSLFKRTSDQRRDYRERGESRAMAQHDVLIRSLEKVAGETESEGERWKVKLIVFLDFPI